MEKKTGEKQIGSILNSLIRSKRFTKDKSVRKTPRGPVLTTLGVPLMEQEDGHFFIDLTRVRFFTGIPGFVSYLAKQTLEKCQKSSTDVLVQSVIDSSATPEIASLGVKNVVVYARSHVTRYILDAQEHFVQHLRLVFDALQMPQWGKLLFPFGFNETENSAENDSEAKRLALHFPFQNDEGHPYHYFFLVEYDWNECFLRITIEDTAESRLFLKRIPHRVVKEAGKLHYQQDISSIVEQMFTGIHRECQNQQNEYMEIPGRQPAFFELLIATGLSEVSGAVFRWTQETAEMLLLKTNNNFTLLLAKILLLLKDEVVIQALSDGNILEMRDNDERIYFDLSRKNTRINISLGEQRKQPDVMAHLKKMPNLLNTVQKTDPELLKDYRMLLIHHATSEVLGFVKAMEKANCPSVTTLFIRYRGIVPDALLDDMLSMPEESFHFYGVQRVELRDSIEGAYILSRQYSPIDNLERLDQALRDRRGDYLMAMRFASFHFFLKEAFQALKENRRLLLVEDGGYVAPLLNRFCHEGKTLRQVLIDYEFEPQPDSLLEEDENIPLRAWLEKVLPVTFEHTANGYYQLRDIENELGKLSVPVFTIALSNYKNRVEAESCAYSILNAVQTIFYGLGKCIMHRRALILGSRGNIGHFLFQVTANQVSYGGAYGVDLRVGESIPEAKEFSNIEDMPEDIALSLDLFIGMTGVSVLKKEFFKKLLLKGSARDLFFASGSTKTVEFSDLTDWLGELARTENPSINEHGVSLETSPIKDPQGSLLQGHRVRVTFLNPEPVSGVNSSNPYKDIYLLGDSMPINFLYYGVPGEVIDGVFEELFSLIAGVTTRLRQDETFTPEIFAIDLNIDKHAERISS